MLTVGVVVLAHRAPSQVASLGRALELDRVVGELRDVTPVRD